MTSTLMKTFFPNFEEVFGHSDELKVILQSKSAPLVTIKDGLSDIKMSASLKFLNPFNEEFEVIEILVELTAGITIELLHDYTISGKVESLSMLVTDLNTFFKTNVKASDLNVKVQALESPLIKSINSQLLAGMRMSVSNKQVKKEFSQTQMFIYDHYLMIEARPVITLRINKQLDRMTD